MAEVENQRPEAKGVFFRYEVDESESLGVGWGGRIRQGNSW